ncbi:MAG: hypothetical protein KDA33_14565 [Phycisphaerales bacterium]|nr:hypothetical protein [Phycisphaerales bacterium]
MSHSLPILENARVASPCNVPWSSMKGDDRVRFCGVCEKQVFNLIGMSDDDVTALIIEKQGKLCVQAYQRPDGTLLTSDCPVGLRAARKKLARAVAALAACFGMLLTATTFGVVGRTSALRLRLLQPFQQFANWIAPPMLRSDGELCVPMILIPQRRAGELGDRATDRADAEAGATAPLRETDR